MDSSDVAFSRMYRLVIDRIEWATEPLRLYEMDADAFVDRSLRCCEQIYREAYAIGNVGVAAAAIVVASDTIAIGRGEHADAQLDRYDPGMMKHVRQCVRLDDDALLTSCEAARALGVSERHIRRLMRGGHLTGRRAPTGAWLCTAPSVLSYRKRNP